MAKIKGFFSAEHEVYVMLNYPKLWKEWVKKFGHHKDFTKSRIGKNKRRVGGVKKSRNRRTKTFNRK